MNSKLRGIFNREFIDVHSPFSGGYRNLLELKVVWSSHHSAAFQSVGGMMVAVKNAAEI